MVWAAIGIDYKSKLILVNGKINAATYIQILEASRMFQSNPDIIFMQDGAPAHGTPIVMDYLLAKCKILHGWPSSSPDENPIEMLWDLLKNKLNLTKDVPSTMEGLYEVVSRIWDDIPQSTVNALVKSFYARQQLTVVRRGLGINDLMRNRHLANQALECFRSEMIENPPTTCSSATNAYQT